MHAVLAGAAVHGPHRQAPEHGAHLRQREASGAAGVAVAEPTGKVALVREPDAEREIGRALARRWAGLDGHRRDKGAARQAASPGAMLNPLEGGLGVTIAEGLQPDQQPARWNDHVVLYEEVFEPL